jgi:ATP synthase protein I
MEDQTTRKDPKKPGKQRENNGPGNFAKYSGLGIQMIVIILITVWGGIKLDKLLEFEKPVFTVILSLLGVFAAIYTAIKDFIR